MPPIAPEEPDLETLAAAARRKSLALIAKKRRLLKNLAGDLEKHGDPELWKRYGDLLLANIATATRDDDSVEVTDYFDEGQKKIVIPGERNKSISEIAEEYFRRYTKARNGLAVINERISEAHASIERAEQRLAKIDAAEAAEDVDALLALSETGSKRQSPPRQKTTRAEQAFKGARSFTSSDGFEILVGKKAADNDFLTFRIAKSLDTWLHAADYPGSHVVIRNNGKREIPQRTLIEAAQLAAFYSDARSLPKAAVNYTLKKFVNKPRKSAPGLVSLASHRSLMVEPMVPFEKAED